MIRIMLLILTTLPILMFGQETKKVTEKQKGAYFKEDFFVLKSDKTTRHGNYQKTALNGELLVNGYYKNGVKDSLWTSYYWGGVKKKSVGAYKANIKVGDWEYYDINGELEQTYNHTKQEIVYFKLNDEETQKTYRIINGSNVDTAVLDRPPLYIGGSDMLFHAIADDMEYPVIARENGVSGEVMITFTIDTYGHATKHRVTKSVGSGCDEEALKAVKKLPDNWLPGLLDGKPVNVEYTLPVKFKLAD